MLNSLQKNQIKRHAEELPEQEVCGFVMENGSILRARNIAFNKKQTFTIHPEDIMDAENNGKYIAIYHSHAKNPEFSLFDKSNAENNQIIYICYCLLKDKFNYYYPGQLKISEYIGTNFEIGKNDCFTLIENYFLKELGVKISILPEIEDRSSDWYIKKPEIFSKMIEANKDDFLKVSNLEKNDILVFDYFNKGKTPHHIGVFLGSGLFLHHPRNKYSRVDKYDTVFADKTVMILRYKVKA